MTKKPRMVVDASGFPVPALHPYSTLVLDVSTVKVTAAGALAEIEVVELYTTELCHIKFGPSDVSATVSDMPFPIGVVRRFSLRGATNISCIKAAGGAGTGKLYITLMV